jgi:hypothetical protein
MPKMAVKSVWRRGCSEMLPNAAKLSFLLKRVKADQEAEMILIADLLQCTKAHKCSCGLLKNLYYQSDNVR